MKSLFAGVLAAMVAVVSVGCNDSAFDTEADNVRDQADTAADSVRDQSQMGAEQIRDGSQSAAEAVRDDAGRTITGAA